MASGGAGVPAISAVFTKVTGKAVKTSQAPANSLLVPAESREISSPRAKFSDRSCSREVEFGAKLLHSIENPPIAIRGTPLALRFIATHPPENSR